jgi:uncharacterized glyoxalase superfamily protein PhnB
MRDLNYRPANVEFDVAHDGSNVPENLGVYETAEEAMKFLGSNFTALNQSLTVSRHMDNKEKVEIRKEYNELLENKLPIYERELSVATSAFNEAKTTRDNAQEMVNATVSEAKALAKEVKRGLVDMRLDELFTARIPYKGRYYFFTYMDKQLKLCAIRDIPEHEKTNIWNAMAKNDEFIDANFPKELEQITAQTGAEE